MLTVKIIIFRTVTGDFIDVFLRKYGYQIYNAKICSGFRNNTINKDIMYVWY